MLTCIASFEVRKRLALLLFDDQEHLHLVINAANKSRSAYRKLKTKLSAQGERVQSFQGLMKVIATVARNEVEPLKIKKGALLDGAQIECVSAKSTGSFVC